MKPAARALRSFPLVHGGGSTPERWRPIVPRFEPSFAVYRIARRGVGDSGDAADYSIARQAEDIAAVVEDIGGPVNALSHSFGGVCALEAALLTSSIRRLILYEPPIVPLLPPGFAGRLQAILDAGEGVGALPVRCCTLRRSRRPNAAAVGQRQPGLGAQRNPGDP